MLTRLKGEVRIKFPPAVSFFRQQLTTDSVRGDPRPLRAADWEPGGLHLPRATDWEPGGLHPLRATDWEPVGLHLLSTTMSNLVLNRGHS